MQSCLALAKQVALAQEGVVAQLFNHELTHVVAVRVGEERQRERRRVLRLKLM